ncbi:MAG: (d)CMP kinase [Alphaproteobacteria bacterium]|nr:(d)CMP kinase [Alphaproteobacteria bacterium]
MGLDLKENVIAIDGWAGSGKGSLTKALAKTFKIPAIDSGAIYRFITYYFDAQNQIENDGFLQKLQALNLKYRIDNVLHQVCFYYNNENIENYIRTPKISEHVSYFSALKSVRNYTTQFLRTIQNFTPLVMDGRDIGTCVYPKAVIKFFIVADIKMRTERRLKQLLAKGITCEYEDIYHNLLQRDKIDSHRDFCPLTKAHDAYQIDNTNITESEFIEHAKNYIIKQNATHFFIK